MWSIPFRSVVGWALFSLFVVSNASVVPEKKHGATRGLYVPHRVLTEGMSWWERTAVCRAVGENGVYKTRRMMYGVWRMLEMSGMSNGVMGACEDVCPCGANGACTTLPSATSSSYECKCNEGATFDGSSCSGAAMEPCGGFAGLACSDDTMICVDDPRDNCRPLLGGADCMGICVSSCAGFTPAPQPGCPEGTVCVDNPDTPDCSIAADCPGVCLPPPTCNVADGTGCWEGYSCTLNPNVVCDSNSDCEGQCVPSCGGFTEFPQPPCPTGTSCVDNPATPDCIMAADCTGVCLPPPPCNVISGDGCSDGYSCTYDPNVACIAMVGADCPGMCAPTCGGDLPEAVSCPTGSFCVNNPATPDCLMEVDCTGVCLPPGSCDLESGEGCSEGFSCTISPTCSSEGSPECLGVCAPTCAGGRANTFDCPTGLECVDNPATPNCVIAADCTGVCLPPAE